MLLNSMLLITLTASAGAPAPLERLDAARRAGHETLAIVAEEVQLGVKDSPEGEHLVPRLSYVWVLGRKRDHTEIAVLRFGDVLHTGWVPNKALRQGEAALELVGEEVVHNPENVRARLAMAYLLVYSREGSQMINALATAAGLCEDVLRINPKCIEARVMLATLINRLGTPDKAITQINKALSHEEHPWLYSIRAGCYARVGLHQKAVKDFEEALARAPKEWHHRQYVRSELEKARAKLKAEEH